MSSKDFDPGAHPGANATVRFYAGLNHHLTPALRFTTFSMPLGEGMRVTDLLDAAGVPCSEVDLVLRNGEPAGFEDVVAVGDRVSIYPKFESLDVAGTQLLRPRPLRHSNPDTQMSQGQ